MADKILCVLAGYDDETEARLSALQNTLYEQGFVGPHTKNLLQHITLGTFQSSDEEMLRKTMAQAAAACPAFDVTFNHIGIFGGSQVLFVAPDGNHPLLQLKEHFGPSFNWAPHTTMLMDQPEVIYQALPTLAAHFKAFQGKVTGIHLYEFWPTRHILSLPLGQ